MEISVADQRILLFTDSISLEDAKSKAWEKKGNSFGALNQLAGFLSRPKDDDFELTYTEHRYQPFWHVAAKAKYVYDRSAKYQVAAAAPEVTRVTLQKNEYEVINGHFHVDVLEHCAQVEENEVFVDGVTGKPKSELKQYLSLSPKVIKGDLEKAAPKGTIFVPPQSRVSAIMRDSLSKMIKGIQADTILEEHVEVTCVDLYYHPVFAFQYRWKSKGKDAIVEVDGMTGVVTTGSRTFSEYFNKVLDTNFLFDIGADAAGVLVPGGSIAVKVARKYIDAKRAKK